MAVKQGWTGRVFEDFEIGDIYEHPLGRTILDADNIWFTCLTMNTNPIHFDGEYAACTEFKKRLVNSCFTLSLVTGQSVTDLTQNAVANLGWDEVRLPNPLFEGDTVYAKSEVLGELANVGDALDCLEHRQRAFGAIAGDGALGAGEKLGLQLQIGRRAIGVAARAVCGGAQHAAVAEPHAHARLRQCRRRPVQF